MADHPTPPTLTDAGRRLAAACVRVADTGTGPAVCVLAAAVTGWTATTVGIGQPWALLPTAVPLVPLALGTLVRNRRHPVEAAENPPDDHVSCREAVREAGSSPLPPP